MSCISVYLSVIVGVVRASPSLAILLMFLPLSLFLVLCYVAVVPKLKLAGKSSGHDMTCHGGAPAPQHLLTHSFIYINSL